MVKDKKSTLNIDVHLNEYLFKKKREKGISNYMIHGGGSQHPKSKGEALKCWGEDIDSMSYIYIVHEYVVFV